MRTVKWNPFLSGVSTFLGGMLLWAGAARADVSSTNPAAIVVFPKVVVDTTRLSRVDTVIELSNAASHPVNVRCFLVNANGHCSNNDEICDPTANPLTSPCVNVENPGACVAGWQETDFSFRLTSKQPIVWTLGDGLSDLPLADSPGPSGEFNEGSIPRSPEDPMRGELKCIEVGDDESPTDQNDLKGQATIETVATTAIGASTGTVDTRGYNGIGIQAIEGQNNGDNVLVLGSEYNACPNILIVDHFFDDADEPVSLAHMQSDIVRTHLTIVPGSEDFNTQFPITTTVQFLVYNEFEQRFSTSRPVTCFLEIPLSDIDTAFGPTGDEQSIFNVKVQGTLTGQTLVRGVADKDTTHGHCVLAIAEEFHCGTDNKLCGTKDYTGTLFSDAFVPQQRGLKTQLDYIRLPATQPPTP